jgi:hypothetical protein
MFISKNPKEKTMKPQVINGITFEMAQSMVQGTKYKALNKFKQFATNSFDYYDMDSEIDIAVMKAWQTWDPTSSKFNTYATNMINWSMYRALDTYHDAFKINVMVKNDLKAGGETFLTLSKIKLTKDQDFNKKFGLDGVKEFTREHFNNYVYSTSAKTFGNCNVRNSSDFNVDEETGFDIIETTADPMSAQMYEYAEMDHDSKTLGTTEKIIYSMLCDGQDVGAIAKHLNMTKKGLLQQFGVLQSEKDAVSA